MKYYLLTAGMQCLNTRNRRCVDAAVTVTEIGTFGRSERVRGRLRVGELTPDTATRVGPLPPPPRTRRTLETGGVCAPRGPYQRRHETRRPSDVERERHPRPRPAECIDQFSHGFAGW